MPSLIWGPVAACSVYLVVWAICGVCLAHVFAPAHMGLPIVAHPTHDWQHQLATTRNLELPRAISFFFIGLDYQAEHHLFPKIPHANLPLAARITRQWCAERGVEYARLLSNLHESRQISVTKQGSRTTVVWNPWIAKAQAMPDFGDDEWPEMLCIETANAADNAVTLAPGQSHVMSASISITGM